MLSQSSRNTFVRSDVDQTDEPKHAYRIRKLFRGSRRHGSEIAVANQRDGRATTELNDDNCRQQSRVYDGISFRRIFAVTGGAIRPPQLAIGSCLLTTGDGTIGQAKANRIKILGFDGANDTRRHPSDPHQTVTWAGD